MRLLISISFAPGIRATLIGLFSVMSTSPGMPLPAPITVPALIPRPVSYTHLVAFRTGIGMAVYQKGALYEGECGNSGYLGHTTFDKDGALCTCGKRGCLELYCSKVTMCGQYAGKTGKKEEFRVILAEAADGKEPARQIVQEAARCFGIAIANAVKLFDISLVVLGDLPYVENDLFLRTKILPPRA